MANFGFSPEEQNLFRQGILEVRRDGTHLRFDEMKSVLLRVMISLSNVPGLPASIIPFVTRAIERIQTNQIDVVNLFTQAVRLSVFKPMNALDDVDEQAVFETINIAYCLAFTHPAS